MNLTGTRSVKQQAFAWTVFVLLAMVGWFLYEAGRPVGFDPCMRVPIPVECYEGNLGEEVRPSADQAF